MPSMILSRATLMTDERVEEFTLMALLQVYLCFGLLPLQLDHLLGADGCAQRELSPFFFIRLVASCIFKF